jgi:ABC-2 type transport system permease protein
LFTGAGAAFFLSFMLSLFFVPLMPLVAGSVLGALIGVLASRFRRSGFIQLLLLLIFSLGVVWLSWSSGRGVSASAVNAVYESISRRWPPVSLYGGALEGNVLSLVEFIAISVLVFLLFTLLTGRWYGKINGAMTAVHTRGNYRLGRLKTRGILKTLVYRELKAYFASAIWVFNTAFGMLLLVCLAVASLFAGRGLLEKMGAQGAALLPILPLAVCFMVCMSNISCSSVSMEGSRLWLLKSLPVSERTILYSKMAVNFIMTAPACVFAAVLFNVSLRPGLETGLYLFLTPLAYSFFVAPFGLAVNLLLPKLEWTSDAQVVKQSAAVMVAVFAGMAAAGVPLVLSFAYSASAVLPYATAAAALAGAGC